MSPSRRHRYPQQGVALVMALILLLVGTSATVALLTLTTSESTVLTNEYTHLKVKSIAETGAALTFKDLQAGGNGFLTGTFDGGLYENTVETNGSMITVKVHATYDQDETWLTYKVRAPHNLFTKAIYAGNSSEDPDYSLSLSGYGNNGDLVDGDLHVNGAVSGEGNATVTGEITASEGVTGFEDFQGYDSQISPPDLSTMDYPNMAGIVDVAQQFEDHGHRQSYRGSEEDERVPPKYASHIFRKNPTHMAHEYDDPDLNPNNYFLEDPYEVDTSTKGITLATGQGDHDAGNNRVYYVDGNIWIHNDAVLKFRLEGSDGDEASGLRVTFVASGNIYFSDDWLVNNPDTDAVAFIAIKDTDHPDSGNIFMGDWEFGTLGDMHAFLYAENNFHDRNLDETGSRAITVYGNMSAGNQVLIERDFDTGVPTTWYVMNKTVQKVLTPEEWAEVAEDPDYTLVEEATYHLVQEPDIEETGEYDSFVWYESEGFTMSSDWWDYQVGRYDDLTESWTYRWVSGEEELAEAEDEGWVREEWMDSSHQALYTKPGEVLELSESEYEELEDDYDYDDGEYYYLGEVTRYVVDRLLTEHVQESDKIWYDNDGWTASSSYDGTVVVHSQLQIYGQADKLENGITPPALPAGLAGSNPEHYQIELWRFSEVPEP